MYSKWTIFNKVLLIISIVIGVIGVIAISISASDDYRYSDKIWLIVIIGLASVFITNAFWGMLIEMSRNLVERTGHQYRQEAEQLNRIEGYLRTIALSLNGVNGTNQNNTTPESNVSTIKQDTAVPTDTSSNSSDTAEALRRIWNSNK